MIAAAAPALTLVFTAYQGRRQNPELVLSVSFLMKLLLSILSTLLLLPHGLEGGHMAMPGCEEDCGSE